MWTVYLTAAAENEIDEAEHWYDMQLSGLGNAFYEEVNRKIGQIAEHPLHYPVVLRDIRRAVISRFPFSLLFRMRGETIFVVACFHAKRNPAKWRRR